MPLLSFTDIHERVLRQAILHESSMLQTCMLDVSVDCIKILRPDGSLKHMNRSGCIALGWLKTRANLALSGWICCHQRYGHAACVHSRQHARARMRALQA